MHLSNKADYGVQDAASHEALDKPTESRAGYANKLVRLIQFNSNRIYLLNYWHAISKYQKSPGDTIAIEHLVDKNNAYVQELARENPKSFIDRLLNARNTRPDYFEQYDYYRCKFLESCRDIAIHLRRDEPEQINEFHRDRQKLLEYVHDPGQIATYLPIKNDRFDTPEWKAELEERPDDYAIGRWCKILLWYGIWFAMRPDAQLQSHENHWDDAHYALVASYTGWIWTKDGVLIDLLNDLFPHVQHWSPNRAN